MQKMSHQASRVIRSIMLTGILVLVGLSLFVGMRPIVQAAPSTHSKPAVTSPQEATVLYADVQVDTSCNGSECVSSSLAEANTSRKLAVGANGAIYATYWNASGIYVAKSINRGQSFVTPVRVSTVSSQAEIGVSGDVPCTSSI